MTDRGRISFSVIEAGIGVLLIISVLSLTTIAPPGETTETAQLEVYASDVAALLMTDAVEERPGTRSPERTRDAVEAWLPKHLDYHIQTPTGTVGEPPPSGTPTGTATRSTPHGSITVMVWYA